MCTFHRSAFYKYGLTLIWFPLNEMLRYGCMVYMEVILHLFTKNRRYSNELAITTQVANSYTEHLNTMHTAHALLCIVFSVMVQLIRIDIYIMIDNRMETTQT